MVPPFGSDCVPHGVPFGTTVQTLPTQLWHVGHVLTQVPPEQQPLGQGLLAEQAVQRLPTQIGVAPLHGPPQVIVPVPQPSSIVPQLSGAGQLVSAVQPGGGGLAGGVWPFLFPFFLRLPLRWSLSWPGS